MTEIFEGSRIIEEINKGSIKFFSVSDYHIKNNPSAIDISDPHHPHVADKELWDKTKGIYASIQNLDLVIDNNMEYFKYFTTPYMYYKGKDVESYKYCKENANV